MTLRCRRKSPSASPACLRSQDVQVTLVKGGDHRLSREQDIALLLRTVTALN